MGLLKKLFKTKKPNLIKEDGTFKTSGELITEVVDGVNLVDGKYPHEYAKTKKHDIKYMKKCCEAELNTYEIAGIVPAPYYFERVAILSRKEKNYKQEIEYCEKYLNAISQYPKKNNAYNPALTEKGPRYKAIVKRLQKAKELYYKSSNEHVQSKH